MDETTKELMKLENLDGSVETIDSNMLTKEDILEAITESQEVKTHYPKFWKFYEMLMEMNTGLGALQEAIEQEEAEDDNS